MSKKYYWLKLKEDFFEEDTIAWLEEQKKGKEYCLFYLKLCLKSIKTNGVLVREVGESFIPYDIKKLAEITKTNISTANAAMKLFEEIGIVQKLEDGSIYLTKLENMVGSETKWAKYKRNNDSNTDIGNFPTDFQVNSKEIPKNFQTDIEIDIRDRDKEIDKDNNPSLSPQGENDKKIGDEPSSPKPSKESKKKKVYPAIEEQIANFTDEEELQIALAGFVDARKKMKKPLTDYAFYCNLLDLKRLEEKGYNKLECVRFAVSKGWQGFYAPYEGAKKGGQAARANKPVAIAGNKTDYSLIYRKQVGMNG